MDYKKLANEVEQAIIGYNNLNGGVRSRPRTEALKNILFNNHNAILSALKGTAGQDEIDRLNGVIAKKDEEIEMLSTQLDKADSMVVELKKELETLKKAPATKAKKKTDGASDDA